MLDAAAGREQPRPHGADGRVGGEPVAQGRDPARPPRKGIGVEEHEHAAPRVFRPQVVGPAEAAVDHAIDDPKGHAVEPVQARGLLGERGHDAGVVDDVHDLDLAADRGVAGPLEHLRLDEVEAAVERHDHAGAWIGGERAMIDPPHRQRGPDRGVAGGDRLEQRPIDPGEPGGQIVAGCVGPEQPADHGVGRPRQLAARQFAEQLPALGAEGHQPQDLHRPARLDPHDEGRLRGGLAERPFGQSFEHVVPPEAIAAVERVHLARFVLEPHLRSGRSGRPAHRQSLPHAANIDRGVEMPGSGSAVRGRRRRLDQAPPGGRSQR